MDNVGIIPKPPPFQNDLSKQDKPNFNNNNNNNNNSNTNNNHNSINNNDGNHDIKHNDNNNDRSVQNQQKTIQTTATIHSSKPAPGNLRG